MSNHQLIIKKLSQNCHVEYMEENVESKYRSTKKFRSSRGTFISAANVPPIFVAQQACNSVPYCAFSTIFRVAKTRDERERMHFVDEPRWWRKCEMPIARTCVSHVRPRGRGGEGGRGNGKSESGSSATEPRDRPRICKRSFQLTATMTQLGIAANSKSIRACIRAEIIDE